MKKIVYLSLMAELVFVCGDMNAMSNISLLKEQRDKLNSLVATVGQPIQQPQPQMQANLALQQQRLTAGQQQLAAGQQQLEAAQQRLTADQQRLTAGQQQLAARQRQLLADQQRWQAIQDEVTALREQDVRSQDTIAGLRGALEESNRLWEQVRNALHLAEDEDIVGAINQLIAENARLKGDPNAPRPSTKGAPRPSKGRGNKRKNATDE